MATRSPVSHSTSRADLLYALNTIKPAIGKGIFVPVLSHFCFSAEYVTAYDDSIAIAMPYKAGFEAAVPGDLLLRLLGSLTSSDLGLSLKDGTLHVASGRSRFKVPTLPPEAFILKLNGHGACESFEVDSDFLQAVEGCLISTGVDPTHPAQMGLTLVREANGKEVYYTLYSTDNVTMSRYELKGDLDIEGAVPEGGIIMPTEFCRLLLALSRFFNEQPVVAVYEAVVMAHFKNGATLFGKLIQSEKPLDFPGVFSKMAGDTPESHVLPPAWDSTFTRACAVVNPQHPVTSISVEEGVLFAESKSALGEVKDELEFEDAELTAKPFLVDPAHVLRASKVCSAVTFMPRCVLMRSESFSHVISHCSE